MTIWMYNVIMEPATEDVNNQELELKTKEIVRWMGLQDLPSASQVDPENKLGLQGAFKKEDGVYVDPMPASVVSELIQKGNGIRHKLLSAQEINNTNIPLFKEQAESAAQYLAKLGFDPGERKGGLVLGDFDTNHTNIKVRIQGGGQQKPGGAYLVSRVDLVFK